MYRSKDGKAVLARRAMEREARKVEAANSSTKSCGKCRKDVPKSDFYPVPGSTSGLHSYCKPCVRNENNARRALRSTTIPLTDPVPCWGPDCDNMSRRGTILCKPCRMQLTRTGRLISRKMYACQVCGEPVPQSSNGRGLYCKGCNTTRNVRRHGLTLLQYEEMVEAQGDACAICGTRDPIGRGKWHIDHDHDCCPGTHSCGKCVRGLLCSRCNTGLGLFQDNSRVLVNALTYLQGSIPSNELRAS